MACSVGYFSYNLCYTTEVSNIIRGYHVYMSVWSATVAETLNTKPDNREKAKDYDKFANGICKGDLLVGHVPTEISSLFYHSLNNNEQNILTVIVTGRRNREVGFVIPAKLFFQTKDRNSAKTLEIELAKRKHLFPTVILKFRKKGTYRQFPFYVAKY